MSADRLSLIGNEARILVVCTGNICRSPFIERLLQRRLDERLGERRRDGRPIDAHRAGSGGGIIVSSAGTGAMAGWAMDERAAAQLVAHGGDASGFTAQDLTPDLIAESDLVLTATRDHRSKVALMYPKSLRRVFTFRDFADTVDGFQGTNDGVPPTDPQTWVRQVTEEVAARRGLKPPLDLDMADIVDPYRRPGKVFSAMAEQVIISMPAVVRALAG